MDRELKLKELFSKYFEKEAATPEIFTGSGSNTRFRARIRSTDGKTSAIGVFNPKPEVNKAFIEFGKHFASFGLPVPKIYIAENDCYLEEDLGDLTLDQKVKNLGGSKNAKTILEKAIRLLPHFQIKAGRTINYSLCYAFSTYNSDSVQWDVNYYRECFLDTFKVPYSKERFDTETKKLGDYIESIGGDYFVNRDYQNRNIMVRAGTEDDLVVIDYQQGRKGTLQYDIAKYLAQQGLSLTNEEKEYFLSAYIDEVKKLLPEFSVTEFYKHYEAINLIQGLHRLGTSGYRGVMQGKTAFVEKLSSIILWFSKWIEDVEKKKALHIELPEILNTLKDLIKNQNEYLKRIGK